ncbi:MAG: hypothetical protein IJS08_03740 [Victivallales bacterium]|nr:hypothetical protein [Victivallales bacterium]
MDLTIEHHLNEIEGKRKWRKVYFAFAAPGYVACLIYILINILTGLNLPEGRFFVFTVAALFIIGLLSNWPRTWRMYRELFRRQGAFEQPTIIHLADNFIETSCGENHSKVDYRIYTHFFCMKDYIALLHKRTIVTILDRKDFPDCGEEWMACLEANGVKKKCFWDFRRWWAVLLFLFALLCLLTIPCAADNANTAWGKEKGKYTACVSYLKMTGINMRIYADENNGYYPPNWNTLASHWHWENKKIRCPGTKKEYKYVPYCKEPKENAANQPIIIEDIGSHWKKKGLFFGRRILRTSALFADGHVLTFDNLPDYMDIYEQYGKYLSAEDAQVLKDCCEAWDKERNEVK